MNTTLGTVLIAASLVPYLFYAGRDNKAHFKLRKVPLAEHLLHAVLLLTLLIACSGVFGRDLDRVVVGFALFVPPAICDELIFHRDIPVEEHDLHAKEHLLLFVFVVVGLVVALAERNALPFIQRGPG